MTVIRITTSESTATPRGAQLWSVLDWLSRYAAISTTGILLLFAGVFTPSFYGDDNIRVIALQSSALGIVVLGQTVVLLVRGLDMSVSAVVAITGVLVVAAGNSPDSIIQSVALVVAIALAIGVLNGVLVTWRRVPPFIATYIVLIVANGGLLAYTRGQSSGSAPGWLRQVGTGSLWKIPLPLVIWMALGIILFFSLTRTVWGRHVYSVGVNREAARHAGVPVVAITMSAYLLASVFAVIAGLVYSGYQGYVDENLGVNVNLNSIAAAIIGGVAFSGGRGGVPGAAVGAILLTILTNIVVVAGLGIYWQFIAQGLVLVIAVVINGLRDRLAGTAD